MRLKDLSSGMWVELRDGTRMLILENADTLNYGKKVTVGVYTLGFEVFTEEFFNSDMTHKDQEQSDIIRVYYDGYVASSTYSGCNAFIVFDRK